MIFVRPNNISMTTCKSSKDENNFLNFHLFMKMSFLGSMEPLLIILHSNELTTICKQNEKFLTERFMIFHYSHSYSL